jgi:hypothetical protein
MLIAAITWETVLLVAIGLFYVGALAFLAWVGFQVVAAIVDRRSQRRLQREMVGAIRNGGAEAATLNRILRYHDNYAGGVRGWGRRPKAVVPLLEEILRDLDREGPGGFSRRYDGPAPDREAVRGTIDLAEERRDRPAGPPPTRPSPASAAQEKVARLEPPEDALAALRVMLDAELRPLHEKLEHQQRTIYATWAGVAATSIGSVAAVIAAVAQLLGD